MFDIERIKEIFSHRNPFLLVNLIFFLGHFPDYPEMPGVLILEALAQDGGTLCPTLRATIIK